MDKSLVMKYQQALTTIKAAVSRAWWTSLLAAYFFVQLLAFPEFSNGRATAVIIPLIMHAISPIFVCGRGGIIEYAFSFFHALTLGYTTAALRDRLFGQTVNRVAEIFCMHTILAHQIIRENMFTNLKKELKTIYVFIRVAAAARLQNGTSQPSIPRYVLQWHREQFREILWNMIKRAGIQAAVLRWSLQQIYDDPELENPPFRLLYVIELLVGLRYGVTALWALKRVLFATLEFLFILVLDLIGLGIDALMGVVA